MGRYLTDVVFNDGPTAFEREELDRAEDLFEDRAALFYTPTSEIPEKWIGSGTLDVVLPIATPSAFELNEVIGYRSARMWVDLLQRATGKIRWSPLPPLAHVTVELHDVREERYDAPVGAKALVDPLKAATTGRADGGRLLYYFGAIIDDSPRHIELEWVHAKSDSPGTACTRVAVK